MIEYLISPRTVDEWIWASISRKMDVLNKVGLSKDSMNSGVRNVNQQTLDEIFKKMAEKDATDDVVLD